MASIVPSQISFMFHRILSAHNKLNIFERRTAPLSTTIILYGKAIDSTDIIKTHNATRLLTLTNLEQVYKYSYFVPTSSIGVELLTRTAALTRNELNEMISVWLDEMAESHTTVTTGRYVEAYINEQK